MELEKETKIISRNTVLRHCFTIKTKDDDEEEEPERLKIEATAVSHLIEFVPDEAVIWIVDDDSKFSSSCTINLIVVSTTNIDHPLHTK